MTPLGATARAIRRCGATPSRALVLVAVAASLGCGSAPRDGDPCERPPPLGSLSFRGDDLGWSGGSADYPVAWEGQMEIALGVRDLPPPLTGHGRAFYTAGRNDSDDLFFFLKRRLTGLVPLTAYSVRFRVVTAGDGRGAHLHVKAGATSVEPGRVVVTEAGTPYYRMNVDKGVQANGGADALYLGPVRATIDDPVFACEPLDSPGALEVTSDRDGSMWLFVGADSSFEVLMEAYWLRVDVSVSPATP